MGGEGKWAVFGREIVLSAYTPVVSSARMTMVGDARVGSHGGYW